MQSSANSAHNNPRSVAEHLHDHNRGDHNEEVTADDYDAVSHLLFAVSSLRGSSWSNTLRKNGGALRSKANRSAANRRQLREDGRLLNGPLDNAGQKLDKGGRYPV